MGIELVEGLNAIQTDAVLAVSASTIAKVRITFARGNNFAGLYGYLTTCEYGVRTRNPLPPSPSLTIILTCESRKSRLFRSSGPDHAILTS
jgi:hypothetical protein